MNYEDFPRPMGATSRFIRVCAACEKAGIDAVLGEERIPWHIHRQAVVVSHGICDFHYAELEAEIDAKFAQEAK